MARRTTCGLDKPSLQRSTGNSLAGKLKVGSRKEITSEAKRLSQPQRRKRHNLRTSKTRAREALIGSRPDLYFGSQKTLRAATAEKRRLEPCDASRKSDGFTFRKTNGFPIRNDGRETTSVPRLNRKTLIGSRNDLNFGC